MKKLVLCVLVCLLAVCCVAGCGQKSGKAVNIEQMVNELLSVPFDDELTLLETEAAQVYYGINNAEKMYIYTGSGATAEEIAVFEFSSEADAESAAQKANEHISAQKAAFASYVPAEVPRLENAVVKCSGKYLAVCVSGGTDAAEIIAKYLK